ncbi:MAG: hypothetical protein ACLP9Y_32790, partial [Mycobacterium sp.]
HMSGARRTTVSAVSGPDPTSHWYHRGADHAVASYTMSDLGHTSALSCGRPVRRFQVSGLCSTQPPRGRICGWASWWRSTSGP